MIRYLRAYSPFPPLSFFPFFSQSVKPFDIRFVPSPLSPSLPEIRIDSDDDDSDDDDKDGGEDDDDVEERERRQRRR